jgi:glycine/D-amino acid oxidase-like deaminating enzyme
MTHALHPWGTPPWTIDFHPKKLPLPDQVDFAIVGAGFTGLSAAANLARLAPGKSILVLESATLGHGASGRTGGMALAETAAGPLPGLGDPLAGYKKILRQLKVDSHLHLPGAYELSRSNPQKNSPIQWNDSGKLGVVNKVPGGTINPGKVVSGLARAAQKLGAQIVEHAEALCIEFTDPPQLHVKVNSPRSARGKKTGRREQKIIHANKVLLATNAASLEIANIRGIADPMLTLAFATAPLTLAQRKAIGLADRRPFYTVDFPYLWGRLVENNGAIFGAGIVGVEGAGTPPSSKQITSVLAHVSPNAASAARHKSHTNDANPLAAVNVHKGPAADRLKTLEHRVRNMHPALKNIRVTHRWGGPILFTEKMRPIFSPHSRSENVLVLAGFNGHGVALSVYLGHWAAQSLLGHRPLPHW